MREGLTSLRLLWLNLPPFSDLPQTSGGASSTDSLTRFVIAASSLRLRTLKIIRNHNASGLTIRTATTRIDAVRGAVFGESGQSLLILLGFG
jgi:hypothetical protein